MAGSSFVYGKACARVCVFWFLRRQCLLGLHGFGPTSLDAEDPETGQAVASEIQDKTVDFDFYLFETRCGTRLKPFFSEMIPVMCEEFMVNIHEPNLRMRRVAWQKCLRRRQPGGLR
ncbi:hypothetical protein R3P38DRAFT_3064553 [Favolaschia claudopus]|uniref:Uncharacterized protein n=1 Tax=Favolaschia claudopus TaxID=2862362 RepID=A0AAW0A1Z9_9AGAR